MGTKIKALAPTIGEWHFNLLIKGNKYVRVFPEPVFDETIISLPCIIAGIAFFCMGSGLWNFL